MARPLRVELEGGLYHVIARGNDRRNVFRDAADRRRFLARLAFYAEKHSFRVVAYCLMENHGHLAIERGRATLAKITLPWGQVYVLHFRSRGPEGGSAHLSAAYSV